PYEGTLRIEADSGQSIQITLRAFFLPENVDPNKVGAPGSVAPVFSTGNMPPAGVPNANVPPSDRLPDPSAAQANQPTPEEIQKAIDQMDQLRSPLGFITFPTVERKINPSVPTVEGSGLALVEDGRNHLTISWPAPSVDADTYEMEVRVMRMMGENTPLESVWVPYDDVAYEKDESGRFTADIRGLGPNRTYEFRLFTVGQAGEVSPPLPFSAKTRMPLDWTWIYISFAALVLGGLGYLVWRIWLRNGGRPIQLGFPRSFTTSGPFD
ncbi:MAG: fibronectin type III domain-containing protein, partial [Verrucomicrobiae bacterium]|nr:fibronectin type III domain-containing protein [Verrucomicrobiae bacterium]